jgi:phosphatidylserine/phosphatidylglycerophosphate/cardiolipin synthase-like enzyme
MRFCIAALVCTGMACGGQAVGESTTQNDTSATTDVIFSPQPTVDKSHLLKIAALIEGARESVDVAIYSFSDSHILDALGAAAKRGVKVRLVFNDAGDHEKLEAAAKASSMSGKLEAAGVDVRFINKIMHHKFVLIDGPRDDAAHADTARIASGSANWSTSAATSFDENTLLLSGHRELALRLQHEFNEMWDHSRDFDEKPFAFDHSKLAIGETEGTGGPINAFFTSSNFVAKDATFTGNGKNTVADALVAAIAGATKSIHLASGHMRSRQVAEALMARAKASPKVDIKVYLDDQEYISEGADGAQQDDLESCLDDAGDSASKKRACTDKGFLFGRQLALAGIDLRYKFYAYRWDFSYAPQMHHKYMVVDGERLFSGSYNLSDNAEHSTFENMLEFSGAAFAALVAKYEANFAQIFETGRAEKKLDALLARVANDRVIPIVFDSIALTQDQVTDLKAQIKKACPAVDSPDFRKDPAAHKVCEK